VAAKNPAATRELQTKLEQYISSGGDITSGSFNQVEA